MPNLVYTSSNFPFQKFTKILSADVNQCFVDVRSVLNGTGTITVDVLKAGTLGQVLGNNGTNAIWAASPLTTQFNVVIGSAADVTNGVATKSSFASYTPVSGDRVLLLPSYSGTENVTLNVSNLYIKGLGAGSKITGTMTLNSGATDFTAEDFKITDNITVNVKGSQMTNIIFATGKTWLVADYATKIASYLRGMQE